MKNLKIKIVMGFRKDQQYTIGADEAHKAYRLFMNPTERAFFSNGLALTGQNIQSIEPDYNATMGWNPDHLLDGDDWNDIKSKGVDIELRNILSAGKEIAQNRPDLVSLPLSEAVKSSGLLLGTVQ
jgi:hypothetical protein